MKFKHALTLGMVAAVSACSTVTIHPTNATKLTTEPTYQETKSFFLAGLVGERRVNVTEICGDKDVAQMQSQQTFGNGLLGALTLGIYAPHTVKVWCK